MKSKTLITLSLLISLSASSIALACPGKKAGRHMGEFRINKLTQDLNLSQEQVKQFKSVVENRNVRIKQAMESIHSESHTALEKFLTPEQMQKIEERKEHRKSHKRTREARKEHHRG